MKYLHKNGYESLTKENFWNEIMEKWPGEMNEFCYWINEYKKKVGWNVLFDIYDTDPKHIGIKYHDLPIAMQIGIFYQFTMETSRRYAFIIEEEDSIERVAENIKEWFFMEHDFIVQDHQDGKYL